MAGQIKIAQHYNKEYFHGVNSGYPQTGYQNAHPSWKHWIKFVKSKKKVAKWLDVGCAYGYLLKDAADCGLPNVYGIDVSSYALGQFPELKNTLSLADAGELPFGGDLFDVVSMFDVVEHLLEPQKAIAECKRVLKPGGWLILSTPDPIYFAKKEDTHISEHPPSYWMHLLRNLGFSVVLRFPGEIYNTEILAVNNNRGCLAKELQRQFGMDSLGNCNDILDVSGLASEDICVCLRADWSSLSKSRTRSIAAGSFGKLYLLNLSTHPKKVNCRIKVSGDVCGNVFATLDHVNIYAVGAEDKEDQNQGELEFSFILLHGGHILGLSLVYDIEKVFFTDCDINASEAQLRCLPDQYIRYGFVRDTVESLRKTPQEKITILDIGGSPGQIYSFLPRDSVYIIDAGWSDVPNFLRGDILNTIALNEKYDFVIAVDTLEHVPNYKRGNFLAKLDKLAKRSILVIAPFSNLKTESAERTLRKSLEENLDGESKFLREHELYGLPDADKTKRFFADQGYRSCEIPLFYLRHWEFLMFYNMTHTIDDFNKARVNLMYNKNFRESFYAEPAYERAMFFTKSPSDLEHVRNLVESAKRTDQVGIGDKFTRFLSETVAWSDKLCKRKTVKLAVEAREQYAKMKEESIEWERRYLKISEKISYPTKNFVIDIIKRYVCLKLKQFRLTTSKGRRK